MSARYTVETVTSFHAWTPKLFSFRTTRSSAFRFTAGQFARLGVTKEDKTVWRAYSMVSSPYDEELEFFSIMVPGGEFTSELSHLKVGDSLMVDATAFGFLTLDRFHDGRDLWLLATGTGIAPYLSILNTPDVWQRYDNVVLVYSAREADELAYLDTIAGMRQHPLWGAAAASKLRFVPVVTRERVEGALGRRITDMLLDGSLESAVGLTIDAAHARLMICGNPQMVSETRKILQARGLTVSRQSAPGQLAVEQFW
jgi:ferredoxin--NADP+ reductase